MIRLGGLYATLYNRQMCDTIKPPVTIEPGVRMMAGATPASDG